MTNGEHDDPERDAWLSAALRHAPDAQAAPPALSDAILRQARAATTAAPARAAERGAWAAAWAWLARPPVAAGFASVMVATLVGVLWWDQPLDPTRMPPPASETTAAPSGAAPTPAPTAAPPTDAAADRKGAAQAELDGAPEPRRAAPKPAAPRVAPGRAAAPAPTVRQAEPQPEAPAPFREQRAPDEAAPAAAPAPARAPAPPQADAQRRREAAPASDNMATTARDEASATASGALARGAAKAAAPRREDALAPARPAALSALLASVAAQPERWTWQRGGALQAMTPALQRWLVQLDRATAVHWRSAAEPAPADPGSVLRLSRDDAAPAAMLRLTDDAVWFAPASRAELPRAAIDTLKQALDEATR